MKTAHRKSSQQKRRYKADPGAIHRLLNKFRPFEKNELLALNLPPRSAYESIRTGNAVEEDFHTLACVINVVMICAEKIDPLMEQTAIIARDAVMRVWSRHESTGKWGFDGPALQEVEQALCLHEQLLSLYSPAKMMDAMREAMRRVDDGLVLR